MGHVRGAVGVLVIFIIGHASSLGIKLTVEPSEGLDLGGEVTLTCTAQDIGFFDVVRVVQVLDGGEETTISNMGILDQKFKETGRYDANYDVENDIAVLTLTIQNLQNSDFGRYGCKLLHEEETHEDFEEVVLGNRIPQKEKYPVLTASDGAQVSSFTMLLLLAPIIMYRIFV